MAAEGTNLFFIIYRSLETGDHFITKRSSISFGDLLSLKKENLPLAEEKEGYEFFTLSPGDLVYSFEEIEDKILPDILDKSKIYKCVSFTKHSCFFIPMYVASPILNKQEFSTNNKQERNLEGTMIKAHCIKLKIDRLGNLVK